MKDRLKSRESISNLFEKGRRIDVPPLRLIFSVSAYVDPPARMAVSVPKRLHRRAVDRNLLKRRIRESYRLRKPGLNEFLTDRQISCSLVVQFRGREISDYRCIYTSLGSALEKLKHKLSADLADNGPFPQSL